MLKNNNQNLIIKEIIKVFQIKFYIIYNFIAKLIIIILSRNKSWNILYKLIIFVWNNVLKNDNQNIIIKEVIKF